MKRIPAILLIDDDEITNYINTSIIKRADITDELLVALNGREAIETVRSRYEESKAHGISRVPRLILLDINMPIMDGFTFLDAVKSMDCFKAEPVVVAVLTTSLDARDIEQVKQYGVDEFLSKPLTKDSLDSLYEKYFS